MKEEIRLSKLMSERGICSRREADRFIERGWVLVDGKVINELGSKVSLSCSVSLSPEAKKTKSNQVTILLNKPLGYVSNLPEKGYPEAIELITEENRDKRYGGPKLKPEHLKNLAVAGRLDINSTGLLILTQDGTIAKQLIRENNNIEKEYLVRVIGELSKSDLDHLRKGHLMLDGICLKPALVDWINEDQLRFVLKEGRKRQVRRMCEMVGLEVLALKRVRIGNVVLSDLPLGKWRYLESEF